MSKEMFPVKAAGDGLAASHINDLGRVLSNLSGGNQGVPGLLSSHGWITGIAGKFGQFSRVAKVRSLIAVGRYYVRFRYWDEDATLWKDETDDYELDARCFSYDASGTQRSPVLVYDDLLTVRYDGQRGVWVPDQFLFPDSRWAWSASAIAARSGASVSSGSVKLVKESLNAAGTQITWSYLTDYNSNTVTVTCFNGFPDEIPEERHVRIGWNSLGQYEIKGLPCEDDSGEL